MMKDILRENDLSNFAATAQEEAEKINAQTNAGYVTDQAFWEKQGIFTGEELAISVLNQTYSDLYKSLYNVRPKSSSFTSVEHAHHAISDLDRHYHDMAAKEEIEAQEAAEYKRERDELEALMPNEFDFDEAPKHSGMGRRTEGCIRITVNDLEKIINEAIDGHPYDGRIEDLAAIHGSKWAHGSVVDPQGWDDACKLGAQFTIGKAPSILSNNKKKITEASLRALISTVLKEQWDLSAYNTFERKNISRLRREIRDILVIEIAGIDVGSLAGDATAEGDEASSETSSIESDAGSGDDC
jgi:hypothetical protein